MPRRRNKRRRLRGRLLKIALCAMLVPLVLSALTVLSLRWMTPPFSAFMLRHVIANIGADKPVPLRYQWVPLSEISPHMLTAVVAAEDQRFAEHSGFDFVALRNAWEHNRRGGPVRGGSSISQQVAKNLFLWPAQSMVRKGVEAYLTLLIELSWPKSRILEVYVNIAQFGDGIYGIGAASDAFFGKPPKRLLPYETALLAAVLPNPVRLKADAPSAYVRQRQYWILEQMRYLRLDARGIPHHPAAP